MAGALAVVACASAPSSADCLYVYDDEACFHVYDEDLPDEAAYAANVHPFLENRCGSLDCHGALPRALRIEGKRGLRYVPEGGTLDRTEKTTEQEMRRTWRSLVNLEPELMMAFRAGGSRDAESLLILRKPLALAERHKGGQVIAHNDAAFTCLTEWLKTGPDAPLSPNAVAKCAAAQAQDTTK